MEARAAKIGDGEIVLRQGRLTLTAALPEERSYTLKAPREGAMARSVRENVSCRARYQFEIGKRTLLSLETEKAAFEYEYPPA